MGFFLFRRVEDRSSWGSRLLSFGGAFVVTVDAKQRAKIVPVCVAALLRRFWYIVVGCRVKLSPSGTRGGFMCSATREYILTSKFQQRGSARRI